MVLHARGAITQGHDIEPRITRGGETKMLWMRLTKRPSRKVCHDDKSQTPMQELRGFRAALPAAALCILLLLCLFLLT